MKEKIILVDDSLVRGTTSSKIVKMLYDNGAKEIHVRIASPEIKYPDYYGVDMPTKDELLAYKKNNQEMCEYIKAKSLKFLSLNGLYKALINEKAGKIKKAKKYAKILGYNYNSSKRYEEAYKILNKDYKMVQKKDIKKDNNLFKKIIEKIK